MKALYLDCASGISGNMFLGACLQLGVPEKFLRSELEKLRLPREYEMEISDVSKNGIGATYVDVKLPKDINDDFGHTNIRHIHRHEHIRNHTHRTFGDIKKIIEASDLSASIKNHALAIFSVIAKAEGKVHQRPADEVTFHEVGAIDSIVDIVGCAICLDYLEVGKIFVSRINTGSGFVKCAHGLMPIPAPATAELLQTFKTYHFGAEKELTTPTGAAIVNALAEYRSDLPEEFSSEKIGYGAGSWDLDIPNVLRIYLGEYGGTGEKNLVKLEANIDDMNPQIYGWLYDRLFAAGALDVWTMPIYMKKNRPAHMLTVLVDAEHRDICTKIIFEETTTIGLRVIEVARRMEAVRKMAKVETRFGEVQCKVSAYDGKIVSITPEYEDCRRLAEKFSVPLKVVWQEALTKQEARLG
ncbi:MAG: nickel pincer cofactor biosynthesis protein LarC [Selenomonadaceae bacterium]|nr:nickel pincer cofactor biosynthesis protein LarC [Selenomonadaceae bacterium]